MADGLSELLQKGETLDDIRSWMNSYDAWKQEHYHPQLQHPPATVILLHKETGPKPLAFVTQLNCIQPHNTLNIYIPTPIPNFTEPGNSYPQLYQLDFQISHCDYIEDQNMIDPSELSGFDNEIPWLAEMLQNNVDPF
jgi:hypothetical protein